MSVDWVLHTDSPYLPSKQEIETSDSFSKSWRFSATALHNLCEQYWWIGKQILSDMTPSEMQSLADTLTEFSTQHEDQFDSDQQSTIIDAVEWLEYWADQGFSLTTLY